jgi:DNA (cytosine-5)-methyltransferase 1
VNVLDLFSGIGGFSLGLERAGMRTVAFCELDEYCRAVLRKHWPELPCFNDIRAIESDGLARLGRVDVVCGGFPCQPFSHAGERKGKADNRHLWPEMRRVIALARPAWVIGENVAGLIALALDDVLADLEGLGYAARPFVIPAVAVDARHRRDRVWIVAADTYRAELRIEPGRRNGAGGPDPTEPALNGSAGDVADSVLERLEGRDFALGVQAMGAPRNESPRGSGEVRNTWATEPDVGRVAHGVPARMDRLRCLGNAVVPQVVEEIGRAIMRAGS